MSLRMADGNWCFEEDIIKNEVVGFFKPLYTKDVVSTSLVPTRGFFS